MQRKVTCTEKTATRVSGLKCALMLAPVEVHVVDGVRLGVLLLPPRHLAATQRLLHLRLGLLLLREPNLLLRPRASRVRRPSSS
jgi:hypothetical protein